MEGQCKKSLFASIHKPAKEDGRPRSMVVKVKKIATLLRTFFHLISFPCLIKICI